MTATTESATWLPDIPAIEDEIELAFAAIRSIAIEMAHADDRSPEASQRASEMSRAAHALRRIERALTVYAITADANELRRTVNQLIDNYEAAGSDL